MSQEVACPKCNKNYKNLGMHWSHRPKHRPYFTQQQKEIITGLMMGDGWISRGENRKNPVIRCNMTSKKYLKYIDKVFGCFSTGVSLKRTAKENMRHNKDNNVFITNGNVEDYSNLYSWNSRSHPELKKWKEWYSTGEKIWPKDIKLTPTVLKHWYCGDGHWDNKNSKNRIVIAMSNEIDNTKKVSQMFESVGLPSPSNYNVSERKDGSKGCKAEWTVDQSEELWEYMGEPLPDFYYKWPERYH